MFLFSEKLRKKIKREAMRLLKHKSFQISKPLVSYVVKIFFNKLELINCRQYERGFRFFIHVAVIFPYLFFG